MKKSHATLKLNPILEEQGAYPLLKLDERREELRSKGLTLFDFGAGDPREPTDEKIRSALIDNVPKVSQYPSAAGKPELRESFSGWMSRRHGVTLNATTEVVPATGSKEAVFHAPLAFVHHTHERRGVAYGTPGYPVYERGTLFAGGEVLPVKLKEEDGFLLRPEDINVERTRIVWINYPHNPTGARANLDYLKEMSDFCHANDILLFSDECYNEIYGDTENPPPSILEVTKERTLAFCSLSKRSGMTGYRSAMMAGDPELVAAMKKLRPSVGVAPASFVQDAATAAWSDDEHVKERNRVFSAKRKLFTEFFTEVGLRYLETDASFYLWIEVPEEFSADDEAYAIRLMEEGIVVAPGRSFGDGGAGYIRVALVPTLSDCEKAIEAWRSIL